MSWRMQYGYSHVLKSIFYHYGSRAAVKLEGQTISMVISEPKSPARIPVKTESVTTSSEPSKARRRFTPARTPLPSHPPFHNQMLKYPSVDDSYYEDEAMWKVMDIEAPSDVSPSSMISTTASFSTPSFTSVSGRPSTVSSSSSPKYSCFVDNSLDDESEAFWQEYDSKIPSLPAIERTSPSGCSGRVPSQPRLRKINKEGLAAAAPLISRFGLPAAFKVPAPVSPPTSKFASPAPSKAPAPVSPSMLKPASPAASKVPAPVSPPMSKFASPAAYNWFRTIVATSSPSAGPVSYAYSSSSSSSGRRPPQTELSDWESHDPYSHLFPRRSSPVTEENYHERFWDLQDEHLFRQESARGSGPQPYE
ncbi:hypothetical protein C8J56DRAFT_889865 [Mycena floridula]|nr:hypothetical protein C8J56DRAFT_889865 [Mycena floridula]